MATDIERGGMDVGGPHEPSYYEIALTNRQVVVAFVVLMICLVAAFFSGVWIGREGSLRSQQQLARAAAAAAAGGDRQDGQGQPLQEFKFFNETGKKPGGAGQEATPGARRRRQERTASAAAPSPPPAGAQPEPVGEGEPLPASTPRRAAATGASHRPFAGAGDPAAAAGSAAPQAPASPSASATAGAGSLVIQVFSSADKTQAEKLRDRLLKAGQQAFLSPIDKLGQTMYRVRIGPFASREKAEKAAEQVRKEQRLDTWITPR